MNETHRHPIEISSTEKRKLRENKIRLDEIHRVSLHDLERCLNISRIRAMELSALSEFQSLPSIGIRFACDLIGLGYYSLKQLKGKDGARLLDDYERQIGVWTDPCVEDQFRLVVHFAKNPGEHKNWWDFTKERKAYREKHGYPDTRPKRAWHEMERYQRSARVAAKKNETGKAVAGRLAHSLRYIKRHYSEKLTLDELSREAALSKHHFLRQFKNVYERTPMQYITEMRLKNASRLLRTSKLPIAQIGHQCGFENESAFIRLFRSRFQKTPLHFRKDAIQVRRLPNASRD